MAFCAVGCRQFILHVPSRHLIVTRDRMGRDIAFNRVFVSLEMDHKAGQHNQRCDYGCKPEPGAPSRRWTLSNGMIFDVLLKRFYKLCRRLETVGWILGRGFQANGLQIGIDLRSKLARPWRFLLGNLHQKFLKRCIERRPSGQQFVQKYAHAVDVTASIGRFASDQFGRHIGWRAQEMFSAGRMPIIPHQTRKPKVHQQFRAIAVVALVLRLVQPYEQCFENWLLIHCVLHIEIRPPIFPGLTLQHPRDAGNLAFQQHGRLPLPDELGNPGSDPVRPQRPSLGRGTGPFWRQPNAGLAHDVAVHIYSGTLATSGGGKYAEIPRFAGVQTVESGNQPA